MSQWSVPCMFPGASEPMILTQNGINKLTLEEGTNDEFVHTYVCYTSISEDFLSHLF